MPLGISSNSSRAEMFVRTDTNPESLPTQQLSQPVLTLVVRELPSHNARVPLGGVASWNQWGDSHPNASPEGSSLYRVSISVVSCLVLFSNMFRIVSSLVVFERYFGAGISVTLVRDVTASTRVRLGCWLSTVPFVLTPSPALNSAPVVGAMEAISEFKLEETAVEIEEDYGNSSHVNDKSQISTSAVVSGAQKVVHNGENTFASEDNTRSDELRSSHRADRRSDEEECPGKTAQVTIGDRLPDTFVCHHCGYSADRLNFFKAYYGLC
ncbi:hypothetical protein AAG570_007535 [Ranatra chinensis]|uniref:Uncharacterized protein n=1 Tax=Ranatra chinensis TaxID=642074 RepID=A0ABD0XW72_9HEMI